MIRSFSLCLLLACAAFAEERPAIAHLARCRAMLPMEQVTMSGAIILRSRRGIPEKEFDYTMTMNRMKNPATEIVEIRERGKTNVIECVEIKRPGKIPSGNVCGTDVTWTDLTLDFLWWPKAEYEEEREGETVHGQKCNVILVYPPADVAGVKAVRVWMDKKTGVMMQAEELDEAMQPKRRMWGTRIKKFGERWMANVLEVETLGSKHRTKITIEELNTMADTSATKSAK